jgi:hypothetical protein
MEDKDLVLKIINEYGKEYVEEVLPNLPDSQYGMLESLVLYCFIRHNKFKKIFELGTEHKSRSSYIIQKALLKNGADFIHFMCDFPLILERARLNLFNKTNVEMVYGPIEYVEFDFNQLDFLFIDAHHERDFAVFYLDKLISNLKQNTLVHIHDINLSEDWYDRDGRINEAYELIQRHKNNTLNIKKLFWLEDFSVNPNYEDSWNKIKSEFDFIGNFPATSLPYNASASYWTKI